MQPCLGSLGILKATGWYFKGNRLLFRGPVTKTIDHHPHCCTFLKSCWPAGVKKKHPTDCSRETKLYPFLSLFVSFPLSQKVGQDLSFTLGPLSPPACSKWLHSTRLSDSERERGRCDGQLIKGGFVCRHLHFVTSGLPSPLARTQTGVKELCCCFCCCLEGQWK